MPIRKRLDKRREPLSQAAMDWLRGDDRPSSDGEADIFFASDDELAELWAANRDWVLAEHILAFPGTRPARWWQYDAPENRRRIGGSGDARHEFAAVLQTYRLGIAQNWINIDNDDPPRFETEAEYLERLALWLPGEKRRAAA